MRTEYLQRLLGVDDTATGLQRVQTFVDQVGQIATEDEQFLK